MTNDPIKTIKLSGFIEYNHFQILEVQEGEYASLKVELTEVSLNPYGYAHGGLIFGLGDTAMGIVAASTGKKAVSHNCSINYLRPTIGKELIAKATMIKNGAKTCYIRCDFYDDNNKLTATMDGNYFYVD